MTDLDSSKFEETATTTSRLSCAFNDYLIITLHDSFFTSNLGFRSVLKLLIHIQKFSSGVA